MTVLPEVQLKAMIMSLVKPDEVIFEYDNEVFDSEERVKRIKRLLVTKEGKTSVFATSFPAARKTLQQRGIDITKVIR